MPGGIIALIIVAVIIVLVLYFVGQYNGLIKLRNVVQESWRQIDVELQPAARPDPEPRRDGQGLRGPRARDAAGRSPNARAAAAAPGASPAQQAQQENVLTAALGRLFAVAEAYPDLKANQNFLQLQRDLTDTEDRVAASRRFYNANVRALNTKVETVPSNIVAGMFNIKTAEYFEVEDAQVRAAPQVSFGTSTRGRPPRRLPPPSA